MHYIIFHRSFKVLYSLLLFFMLSSYANDHVQQGFMLKMIKKTDDQNNQSDVIRKEVPMLTYNEAKLLEAHLKVLLKQARTQGTHDDQEYYEYLLRSFWQGHYDSVIAELKSLGENPQSILKPTGLRESLLNGSLVSVPWYIREIATIPAMDFKKIFDASYKNKLLYLESMLERLRNAPKTDYIKEMQQALVIMQEHLQDCKKNVTGVFLTKVNNDLTDVEELLKQYAQ